MEEKIISKSKQYNIKKVRNIIWLTGLALAVAFMLLNISEIQHFLSAEYVAKYGPGDGILDIVLFLVIFGGSGLIIGQVFYSCMSKVSLTITDKRVYGTAAFGKRVDLPLDSISAVGTSAFKGIAITSASGAIKFGMVKNRDEIHSAISKLLVERQNKPVATTTIKQEIPQSNAKELKNYKELLDMGVISQEEFDAKKKAVVGAVKMERHFNGSSECPQHGVFNWKGYVLENDFTVGKWDDLCQNCGEISLINGEYHIPTICPHCHCTVWVVEKE